MRATALAMAAFLAAASVHAGEPSSRSKSARMAEAEAKYAEGLRLIEQGKLVEALAALDASATLAPSPNTQLLRGHALRLLGRRVEAMQAYQRVVTDAGAHVREGDMRYEPTLADAGTWIAILRPELGEITIEVRSDRRDVSIAIDGKRARAAHDAPARVFRLRAWHEPGTAEVVVRSGRIERRRRVNIAPGGVAPVSIDARPPPPPPDRSHAPPIASWVSWGIATGGFTVLAAAGAAARSGMSDLEACKPHCAQDLVDEIETRAIIANVGLGIGLSGLLAGGIAWIVTETSD